MSADTHCVYCGREFIEVTEPGLYDSATGEREQVTWTQCPRYPSNRFIAMFSGVHESFRKDMPLLERTYR